MPSQNEVSDFFELMSRTHTELAYIQPAPTVDDVNAALQRCPNLVVFQDNYGNTLLHNLFGKLQSNKHLVKLTKLLVDGGASLGVQNIHANTPLYDLFRCARSYTELFELTQLLVKGGAPLGEKNNHGNTPLHYLFVFTGGHNNLPQIVKLLVEGGAPLDVKNNHGYTPLDLLSGNNYVLQPQMLQAVELLLRHGPYPDDALHRRIEGQIQFSLNTQMQAQACQQALALCPYGYLQTAIGLDALKEHIDACAPENIHEPAPGSVYPPLWHAVGHGDEGALVAAIDKMGGLDFGVCLPGSSVTLGQFLGRLEGGQIVAPKHAVVRALFYHLHKVDNLVLENYLNLNNDQGEDDLQYQSDANCLNLLHGIARAEVDTIKTAVGHMGGLKLDVCLPNSQIPLGDFLNSFYPHNIPQTWIAIAVTLFEHIRSTVTLEQLNAYLDSDGCSQENINDAMHPSPYSPLWCAVALLNEGAMQKAFDKGASLSQPIGPGLGLITLWYFQMTLTTYHMKEASNSDLLPGIQSVSKKLNELRPKSYDQ